MGAASVVGMSSTPSLAECREAIAAARTAAAALGEVLWQGSGSDLGDVLEELSELACTVDAAEVAVVGEAMQRGEPLSGGGARTVPEWVAAHSRRYRAMGATRLVRVAQATSLPAYAILGKAVRSGQVGVANAAVCLTEMEHLAPRLRPEAMEAVWGGFVTIATSHGPREIRQLREGIIARFGADHELDDLHDIAKTMVSLSAAREVGDGLSEYLLRLDPEGRAALEAAIGPLSAPRPTEGVRDLRSSDRRRGDALVEVCRRATSAGTSPPVSPKAQVVLTMALADLVEGIGSATTVGGVDAGRAISPRTVRRIACDAGVIPAVLGAEGEVIELGRSRRLFSRGQVAALWLRDAGCSFPGCTIPAHWTDAHHLRHWADGGSTDLSNAALLCGRHHTIVHQRGYHGTVTPTGVTWHLTSGAYDQWLAQARAAESGAPGEWTGTDRR